MQFIDLKKQYQNHKEELDAAIHSVLDDGRYIMGPVIGELEESLAEYAGAKHCIAVSSGTCSLQVALMSLGVGPGDEVITVPFTWISTAEVIKLVGARPVFVDIEEDTYNMDPDLLEKAITPRTKAIITVDLFGQMADYRQICPIAKRHGIPIIEDAAQSFGARQDGRPSCGVTEIASTSFFPAKPLGCYGDGGAVFCHDDKLADSMRAIRNHGGARHHHHCLGMNARLDSIQAAVLKVKLRHFNKELVERERIGLRYSELLRDTCTVPSVMEGNTHVYAIYTIRVAERNKLAETLKEKGIPSPVYYPKCLHEQPVFADLGYAKGSFPVSEKASREVISLPMHPWLTEEDQDSVIDAVKMALIPIVVQELLCASAKAPVTGRTQVGQY